MCERLLANPLIESYEVAGSADGPMSARVGVVVFPGSLRRGATRSAPSSDAGLERASTCGTATRDLQRRRRRDRARAASPTATTCAPGAIARFAPVMEAVRAFAREGGPVLGICNGFQVLCEARPAARRAAAERVAAVRLPPGATCVVEHDRHAVHRARATPGESLSIPVKHTTGRWFAPGGRSTSSRRTARCVLRYAPGRTRTARLRDVAGVANEAGNVLGLMPHPEHAVDPLTGSTDGLRLFGSLARAPSRSPA